MAYVGKNLRYLRTLFDLTVTSMAAEVLQTGESNYRKMEGNHSGITFEKAKLISDFFEISLNELFDPENHALAKVIGRKDEGYMERVIAKLKSSRERERERAIRKLS